MGGKLLNGDRITREELNKNISQLFTILHVVGCKDMELVGSASQDIFESYGDVDIATSGDIDDVYDKLCMLNKNEIKFRGKSINFIWALNDKNVQVDLYFGNPKFISFARAGQVGKFKPVNWVMLMNSILNILSRKLCKSDRKLTFDVDMGLMAKFINKTSSNSTNRKFLTDDKNLILRLAFLADGNKPLRILSERSFENLVDYLIFSKSYSDSEKCQIFAHYINTISACKIDVGDKDEILNFLNQQTAFIHTS